MVEGVWRGPWCRLLWRLESGLFLGQPASMDVGVKLFCRLGSALVVQVCGPGQEEVQRAV